MNTEQSGYSHAIHILDMIDIDRQLIQVFGRIQSHKKGVYKSIFILLKKGISIKRLIL